MKRSNEPFVTFHQALEVDEGVIACPRCEHRLPCHEVNEAWIHVPKEAGWIAAYRIVPSGAELAIAEIRLFPREDGQKAGRWSGDPSSVPLGGPPSRIVRSLTTSSVTQLFDEIVERWDEQTAGYIKAEVLKRFGLERSGASVAQRPGRKGRDDMYFATWAAAYVERLQAGDRSPIQTLAEHPPVRMRGQLRISGNTVRGIIAEARSRNMLSAAPAGRAGGTLTPEAIEALGSE